MSALYYGRVSATGDASAAAASFPASNFALESLERPWHGVNLNAHNLSLYFSTVKFVKSIEVHDVNFLSCSILTTTDDVTYTNIGTMTTYSGRFGRRRGIFNISANVLRVVCAIPTAASSTDGLAYWRAGAGYAFNSKFAFPTPPEYPFKVSTKRPQEAVSLKNGRDAICNTGPNVDMLTLNIKRKSSQVYDTLVQQTALGTCVLDMEMSNYPERIWPVRFIENQLEENLASFDRTDLPIPLKEVV